MGEHSPCDALVPSIVSEYATVQGVDWEAEPLRPLQIKDNQADGWERLDWVTDELIQRECVGAEDRARAIIKDSDDSVLWFNEYGADWIKSGVLFFMAPTLPCDIFGQQSEIFAGCLSSNGPPTRLVSDPWLLHCNLRDSSNTNVCQRPYGDDTHIDGR